MYHPVSNDEKESNLTLKIMLRLVSSKVQSLILEMYMYCIVSLRGYTIPATLLQYPMGVDPKSQKSLQVLLNMIVAMALA